MTVLTIISIILIESAAAGKLSFNDPLAFFDSDTLTLVKELVTKEKQLNKAEYCIKDKKTLDAVLADKDAWKYMINEICTKSGRHNVSEYLEDRYGMKNENLKKEHPEEPEDQFSSLTMDGTKGNPTTAVVPLKLNTFLFLKLNASECIKQSVDVSKRAFYRMIKECVWPKYTNTPYLIMDKYTGTFEDKIVASYGAGWEGKNYPKGEALEDMIKITEELLGLHEKKIANRDLRPENIMVSEKNIPILGNFDFATPLGAETAKGPIISDDPYMDYEMAYEKSNPMSSDIYSLFVIFARIFLGDDHFETIKKKIKANSAHPKFGKLSVPDDFKWTENMFKNSITFQENFNSEGSDDEELTYRWRAQDVLDELTKMKNNLDLQNLLLI